MLLRAVDRLLREPVRVTAFVQALIAAGVAFGLDLTDAQTAAVLGLSVTGMALAELARGRVTPVRQAPDAGT